MFKNNILSGTKLCSCKFLFKAMTKGKKLLQGEKIETPSFILKNDLKIDYALIQKYD